MGSDDTRRYRATDSDAITHDKNMYGVYLHTLVPTLVPTVVPLILMTVTMETLEFPSNDHGTHPACVEMVAQLHVQFYK